MNPPAKVSSAPPRPRRRWRRVAAALALLALGAVGLLVAYVYLRDAPGYYGRPEALLPRHTACVATWLDFSGFLRNVEDLRATGAILDDSEAASALPFVDGQEGATGASDARRSRLVNGPARLFIDTYLGRELTVALVPPPRVDQPRTSSSRRTAIVVIARTRFGVEERVAQLVAEYAPGVPLEKEVWRDHVLLRYRGRKPRDSVVFCRFGQTVVACLRTDRFDVLREIVDRKTGYGREGDALSDAPAFAQSGRWRAGPREMAALVIPERMPAALAHYPSKSGGSAKARFWARYLAEVRPAVEWVGLRASLGSGFSVDSFWSIPGGAPAPAKSSAVAAILDGLPATSPAAAWLESPELRRILVDLYEALRDAPAYRKDVRAFRKDWRDCMGGDLASDYLQTVGSHVGMVLTGIGRGLVPMPAAHSWWSFEDAGDAKRAAGALPRLPLASSRPRAEGQVLHIDWNRSPGPSNSGGDALSAHPLLAGFLAGAPPLACVLVDTRNSDAELRRVEALAALWSAGDRDSYREWRKVFAVAKHFRALRLGIVAAQAGLRVDLLVDIR